MQVHGESHMVNIGKVTENIKNNYDELNRKDFILTYELGVRI